MRENLIIGADSETVSLGMFSACLKMSTFLHQSRESTKSKALLYMKNNKEDTFNIYALLYLLPLYTVRAFLSNELIPRHILWQRVAWTKICEMLTVRGHRT